MKGFFLQKKYYLGKLELRHRNSCFFITHMVNFESLLFFNTPFDFIVFNFDFNLF